MKPVDREFISAACQLIDAVLERSDDASDADCTWWMFASDVTKEPYGPFSTREDAMEFAGDADGSVFECSIKEV